MLQQFEYDTGKFTRWLLAYPNLFAARKRGVFVRTTRAKFMHLLAYTVYALWIVLVTLVVLDGELTYGLALLLAVPVTGYVLIGLTACMQLAVVNPRQNREITKAKQRLSQSKAVRIAVLGSFGKTSMKELLLTVLSEGKKVAATPGNKNVLISHARWVNTLAGDEDVLIFEYGEAAPGDIARFAQFSRPTHAVVTGIAPAHLDYYPSLEAVADDFAQIHETIQTPSSIWFNNHSPLLAQRFRGAHGYTQDMLDKQKVSDTSLTFAGTTFTVGAGNNKTTYTTQLLGRHHIGPLLAVIAIAHQLGLTAKQIQAGVAATKPYEHRMQPKQLHGAWIIDDAYNGNIVGMQAGLDLLMELPAKRRIYVTPGLVDQGAENQQVHTQLGVMIGRANPDRVVIMQNSNTQHIQRGLQDAGYKGDLHVESDPLEYYTNLEHQIAAGDVVMLQNDLPDSYK
jgi:UDP-N-acetylmuramoyl-tripeptide--D-alanyl-D-alanine ligase